MLKILTGVLLIALAIWFWFLADQFINTNTSIHTKLDEQSQKISNIESILSEYKTEDEKIVNNIWELEKLLDEQDRMLESISLQLAQ